MPLCLWLKLHWSATSTLTCQLHYSIKVVVSSMYVASNIIMYHAMYSMCTGFTLIATLVQVYSQFVKACKLDIEVMNRNGPLTVTVDFSKLKLCFKFPFI